MKFEILFYEDSRGNSPVWDYLKDLETRMAGDKSARIELNQIMLNLELLERLGTKNNAKFTKKIEDDLWELRPGNNRILYFYNDGVKFVLLHIFRKKTKQTPEREKQKARNQIADFIANGGYKHENMD